VQAEYHDAGGRLVTASPATVAAVEAEIRAEDALSPLLVLHPGDPVDGTLEVVTEDGRSLQLTGTVGADVPLGYHTWNADGAAGSLVVSPGRCHLPTDLHQAGWAVQVYSARSTTSWGIGDLADLRTFGRWAAERGAAFALISPLNATSPVPPIEASPYLPSSRRWRNPLFLRVEDVAGATSALGDDLARMAAAGRDLNDAATIDRDAVAALKLEALRRVLATATPPADFAAWRSAQGEELERFATFCVIAEEHGGDFRAWPSELGTAGSPAVARVRLVEAERVTFHAWLQWLVDEQLRRAARALPLMTDLPIGVDPGGADVWADPDLFARGYAVGAPPDEFNTLGQDWAQPPWNPRALRQRGYAPLAAVLRGGFAHAMGLRIDHVMGLFRLYWIPTGCDPAAGVYVRYPASHLLDVLALESVRARAVVVGEDLGTVEPIVGEQMAARDMLSYRLVYFSDARPEELPRRALTAVTTHDLPTVAGLWTGADTSECRAIGVPVNGPGLVEVRQRLARIAGDHTEPAVVAVSAYRALAASPSMLVAAALEDAAGAVERPNIPGTTSALRPNWSRPLPAPLEDVLRSPLANEVAAAARRDPPPGTPA
jgi:4-alpha-glucanotransferase